MAKYRIETDKGIFAIETEEPSKPTKIGRIPGEITPVIPRTKEMMPAKGIEAIRTGLRFGGIGLGGTLGGIPGAAAGGGLGELIGRAVLPPEEQKIPDIIKTRLPSGITQFEAEPTEMEKLRRLSKISAPVELARGIRKEAITGGLAQIGGRILGKGAKLAEEKIISPAISGFKGLGKISPQKSIKFAQKIRNEFFNSKIKAGMEFGNDLEKLANANLTKTINIQPYINTLREEINLSPKIASDIAAGINKSKDTTLKLLIDNPEMSSKISLQQAQAIKKTIDRIPSISTKLPKGKFANWSDTDISLIDFKDNIKSAQLDVFPEMAKINAKYKTVLGNYNLVKNKFKIGQLLGNIKTGFGDVEIKEAVNKLLPSNIVQEIGGYRNAYRFLKAAGIIGGVSIGAGIAKKTGIVGARPIISPP